MQGSSFSARGYRLNGRHPGCWSFKGGGGGASYTEKDGLQGLLRRGLGAWKCTAALLIRLGFTL
eukprot:397971-Pyramimonas_sp.AAC.1